VGVAGAPEVLPELVPGVPRVAYEQREDAFPPSSTVDSRISSTPATRRDRELIISSLPFNLLES
jgi:hypothetical protein